MDSFVLYSAQFESGVSPGYIHNGGPLYTYRDCQLLSQLYRKLYSNISPEIEKEFTLLIVILSNWNCEFFNKSFRGFSTVYIPAAGQYNTQYRDTFLSGLWPRCKQSPDRRTQTSLFRTRGKIAPTPSHEEKKQSVFHHIFSKLRYIQLPFHAIMLTGQKNKMKNKIVKK